MVYCKKCKKFYLHHIEKYDVVITANCMTNILKKETIVDEKDESDKSESIYMCSVCESEIIEIIHSVEGCYLQDDFNKLSDECLNNLSRLFGEKNELDPSTLSAQDALLIKDFLQMINGELIL